MRASVADAIAAGLQPSIYGSGWEELVDPKLIVADHVDNEELPFVYSSAGVVLNDHWDTMRARGFVSNRIFDVLACGTPVISDYLPEIAEVFADTVPTYRTPADLRALAEDMLSDREAARGRALAGRERILAAHTFDHRARTLVEVLERHNLLSASSPGGRRVPRGCRS
jgi:spore maturation protein CgeB